MSVLMEFAIFPTDKGASVSQYVAKVIKMIRESDFDYKLSPMGTSIETENMQQALRILQQANEIMEQDSERIYIAAKFDVRKGKGNRMRQKIVSIENKIGKFEQ